MRLLGWTVFRALEGRRGSIPRARRFDRRAAAPALAMGLCAALPTAPALALGQATLVEQTPAPRSLRLAGDKDRLFVRAGRYLRREPAVKYRGIFLNDEAPALSGWTREKFGGFNSRFYVKVFESLLRLRANFLWPAMWGNAFGDDDPLNPKLADEYGVVIGTSHHEPMMRAHDEWRRYGKGPWNCATNSDVLRSFWAESLRRTAPYENLVTIGMRGDGDEPMSREANVARLERIVSDQRALIDEILAEKGAPRVPQVWALYKEVQEYYEKGMRVPDDVTLLWCDDNWGNIRRLPTAEERGRPGGAGVYYHFDYVGGPLRLRGRSASTTWAVRARTSGSTRFRSPRSGSRCTSPTGTAPIVCGSSTWGT